MLAGFPHETILMPTVRVVLLTCRVKRCRILGMVLVSMPMSMCRLHLMRVLVNLLLVGMVGIAVHRIHGRLLLLVLAAARHLVWVVEAVLLLHVVHCELLLVLLAGSGGRLVG